MKKRILALLLTVCILTMSGCFKPEKKLAEPTQVANSYVAALKDNKTAEFTEIKIPDGCIIYNADMYDENTAILMLGDNSSCKYQIALYNTDSGLSVIYSGEFHAETGETNDFFPVTLSVIPYVVADTGHQVIYRFNDDFSDVFLLSTVGLEAYTFEYCKSSDSVLYTVSSDSECVLYEYSFGTGNDRIVSDLSRSYSYASVSRYYDASGIAVLVGAELFTDKSVSILIDVNEGKIIGQFDQSYSLLNSTDSKVAASWFTDMADDLYIAMMDFERSTVGDVYRVDMTDCVFSINTDEYLDVFNTGTDNKCVICEYDIAEGVLVCESEFDYGKHSNAAIPIDNNEPINVFLTSSERFSRVNDTVLFGICTEYYYNSLFMWNTALAAKKNQALAQGETIEYPVHEVEERTYFDSNTAYAEAIEEEYGVSIFYGDSADISFQDYDVEIVYDESEIEMGLSILEEALSMYPDGFFEEFSGSGYLRGINFYLCGEMSPIGYETISDPAAFTYIDSGYAIVVANLNQGSNLVSHFCHEISHVIDNRLIAEGILDEVVWNSYNPTGFEYKNSYKDDDGGDYTSSASDEYTTFDDNYWMNGDIECLYFIDSYAKTYPTEDRARIMEYAMDYEEYSSEYFESSHLQAKLKYLSDCIRQCWDSSDWNRNTQWEQYLAA